MTTELRKIRNHDIEKCEILDRNLKELKRDLNEKDKIISELRHALAASNKKAERQKTEITSLGRCVMALEEKLKALHSSQANIENKLTNKVDESTNLKKNDAGNNQNIVQLKNELVAANNRAQRQKNEIMNLSCGVVALEEKLKAMQLNVENKMTNKVDGGINSKQDIVWHDNWEIAPRNIPMRNSTKTPERNDLVLRTKVMMVYGFAYDMLNADDLFNLISLYGNVVRIKILLNKEQAAMVEMDDPVAVERCIQYLHNCPVGSNIDIKIKLSNKNELSDELCPMLLPDHTPCFKNYLSSKNNRFSSAELLTPNKILRFFNAPPGAPDLTETNLLKLLNSRDVRPTAIRIFLHHIEQSSGLIEFKDTADAVLAIMKCNNLPIKSKGNTFILHLNFLPGANVNSTETDD